MLSREKWQGKKSVHVKYRCNDFYKYFDLHFVKSIDVELMKIEDQVCLKNIVTFYPIFNYLASF